MLKLIKRFFRWLKDLFLRIFGRKDKPEEVEPEEDFNPESTPPINTIEGLEQQRYAWGNYLHFGKDDGTYPQGLDIEGAADLLAIFSSDSYAIGMKGIDDAKPYTPVAVPSGMHFCDFCARPISGGEYQVLKDGRERCSACSRSVVREPGDVKNLFRETKRRMEQLFGISFANEIGVSVVNAKKLAKGDFTPTAGFDARAIGYVEIRRGRQVMVLENGAPRVRFMSTCAHELTHCWQNQTKFFISLHAAVAAGQVSREDMLAIVEGHSTWAEVQYLFLVGEMENAYFMMDSYLRRDDEYGKGFKLYMEKYGFTKGPVVLKDTPFNHPENPLAL